MCTHSIHGAEKGVGDEKRVLYSKLINDIIDKLKGKREWSWTIEPFVACSSNSS